jgi:type II secretory pathway component PulL
MKIGFLDWTDNSLTLYLFKKGAGTYDLVDSLSSPLEGELTYSDISALVKDNIDTSYLSLPLNSLTLREETFPFSDKTKIKDTISYELEGMLIGNTSDYSIDHIITESTDTGSKVLAVCIENKKLQDIINLFSYAGLEPKIITSVDLRLMGGNSVKLLEDPVLDPDIRASAAKEEIADPYINLRQNELAYTGDIDRLKGSIRFTACLVLILLILFGTMSFLNMYAAKKDNELLVKKTEAIYRSIFPKDRKIVDIGRQFKGQMNILKKKKNALAGIPVLDIMRSISMNKNNRVQLYELNADGKNIVIKGIASSFEDVESFKDALANIFDNVKVSDSSAASDKKIDCTMLLKE